MRNARKFDNRITVGRVPDSDDLFQLKDLGYKTLIDLREEDEKFGGMVGKRATALGLKYVSIPVSRDSLSMKDVVQFFDAIHEKGSAPIYAFSRLGRKPLAFLLLFEGVSKGEKHVIPMIYSKASKFGFDLKGDMHLHEFLIGILDSGEAHSVVEVIRKRRPDLFID
jgi:protein tyrosine phosphatase (PTP) superfamily phosphohydrolase (DUF442 family)